MNPNHRLYYTVVGHSHIVLRWPIKNACAKSYSVLFWGSSSSIFSNRVPNLRHESLNVFIIPFDTENLALLSKRGFKETSKMLIFLH